MFHYRAKLGLLLACLLISSLASAEDNASTDELRIGTGDLISGKKKVQTENCQECHGLNGNSSSPTYPKLTGQYADYIVKQLQDFQSGRRQHPIMNVMAEGLSEDDRMDIATYFASNSVMHGDDTGENQIALDIYTRGDVARGIPPCQICHGANGKGNATPTETHPVIGGQHRNYLREQLRNWRSGERNNSPNGVMNIVTKFLSDAEIEALSQYISGL